MQITWLDFTVAALATYRISLMVVRETGPAKVFKRVREAPSKGSAVYAWLTCLFCFSMTVSAGVCFALWLAGTRQHATEWFLLWCALSAVAILIHMRVKREEP